MTDTRIIGSKNFQISDFDHQSSNALSVHGKGRFLAPGTLLHEFEIIDVVAMGGFGIVYRAHDHSLDRKVAIKEYMPAVLAERTLGITVSAISSQEVETFQAGLQSFVNEARLLARFDHPALLKVFRFWEENGTAYMAMPLLAGKTLRATLAELGRVPDETWLKEMLVHLLDGLEMLHGENCFHRDIAPDNILMLPDGRPLLLDFGAARRVIGDRTQALTVILKPGYAPPEQYADTARIRQGAWTDIYAMASVLHFAITGVAPQPSISRMLGDTQKTLIELKPEGFSNSFLIAVDKALSLAAHERPQCISQWRHLLGLPANRIGSGDGATNHYSVSMPLVTHWVSPESVFPSSTVSSEEKLQPAKSSNNIGLDCSGESFYPVAMPLVTHTASQESVSLDMAAASEDKLHIGKKHRKNSLVVRLSGAAIAMLVAFVFFVEIGTNAQVDTLVMPLPLVVASAPALQASEYIFPVVSSSESKAQPSTLASSTAPSVVSIAPMASASRSVKRKIVTSPVVAAATKMQLTTSAPTPIPLSSPSMIVAGPSAPGEACADKVFVFRIACISAQCAIDRYRQTKECREFKEMDRIREEELRNRGS